MIVKKLAAVAALAASVGAAGLIGPGTASADVSATNYVATISGGSGAWQFKVRLTQKDDIAAAKASLAGTTSQHINGKIVRTGGTPDYYNSPYTWFLDPNDVQFVDMSMEVCDGSPSDVEYGILTSDRFCPWTGRVTALEQVAI
ncbi:hypothetical protein [Longispora albida]|uniref:BP74-related protein n=1 Tax=Longispora albida TaxID=203523 RepID=UPI00037DD9DF|nr:hypothetical protein [Longispora albida]